MSATETNDRTIVIERNFDASRDQLWRAWTEKAEIEKWFGPEGFSTRVDEYDFRPGGRSQYIMIGPDGSEYPSKGVFKEVDAPNRIVTTDEWGEGIEDVIDMDKLPQGMVSTFSFEELGEKCRVRIETVHGSAEDRQKHEDMGVRDGWESSFKKLDRYLASQGA